MTAGNEREFNYDDDYCESIIMVSPYKNKK